MRLLGYVFQMLPKSIRNSLRHRVSFDRQARLMAATATFCDATKHLRIDFFFSGTSENVDFAALEFGTVGEVISEIWIDVQTVGF